MRERERDATHASDSTSKNKLFYFFNHTFFLSLFEAILLKKETLLGQPARRAELEDIYSRHSSDDLIYYSKFQAESNAYFLPYGHGV